ncbi:hypothetical protein HC251_00590 [Iamia sp. SCSIO 61187]|uniref:glycosyltransferase family 39 protein n=1 Tax=Iamia sp. SCSIO 61187 TaxID=2722752 RepID=UPI001C62A650|nr:glycosyltransferase family 39 protein [Iamia sp. SCSIO 61187]QYG91077.1 hypothetical protein HC251_00590 [Iamia sp. SCSIO 61187]
MRRSDLLLFVAAALVLVALSSVTAWRLDYAPDETSHLTVVEVVADERRPLTWEDTRYGADRGHAYHLYSPVAYLPYVPARWVAEAVGPLEGAAHPDRVVVRFGAWSIAVAQLAATWSLVRRVLRTSSARLALAVAVAVNLVPQLRYMHAYITTDGMTVLAATVAVAVSARVLQRPRAEVVDGLLCGLAIALCAHVRYNALIVGAVTLLALAWRAARAAQPWRPRLRPLGVALAVALVLSAPFHLWVYEEQANRHVTASTTHEQLRESTFLGHLTEDVSTAELIRIRGAEVDEVGEGMWLRFQRYHKISAAIWRVLAVLTVLGVVAALASRQLTRAIKVLTIVLVVAFFVTWVAMAAQWPFTAHGRFLLPVGLPIVAIAASGYTALLGERSRIPAVVVPAAVAAGLGSLLLDGIRALR